MRSGSISQSIIFNIPCIDMVVLGYWAERPLARSSRRRCWAGEYRVGTQGRGYKHRSCRWSAYECFSVLYLWIEECRTCAEEGWTYSCDPFLRVVLVLIAKNYKGAIWYMQENQIQSSESWTERWMVLRCHQNSESDSPQINSNDCSFLSDPHFRHNNLPERPEENPQAIPWTFWSQRKRSSSSTSNIHLPIISKQTYPPLNIWNLTFAIPIIPIDAMGWGL